MGIEALSQDFLFAVFFELDIARVKNIKNNLDYLSCPDRSYFIMKADSFRQTSPDYIREKVLCMDLNSGEIQHFVYFLDPPYSWFKDAAITTKLDKLIKSYLENPGKFPQENPEKTNSKTTSPHIIVLLQSPTDASPDCFSLAPEKTYHYGKNSLSLFLP